jgi:hypothetical protein
VQNEEEGGPKILADEVVSLATALERYTTGARILLHSEKVSRQKIEELKTVIHKHHGSCPVSLVLHFEGRGEADIEIQKDLTIMPSRSFSKGVEKILGPSVLSYQKKQAELMQSKKNNGWQKKAS